MARARADKARAILRHVRLGDLATMMKDRAQRAQGGVLDQHYDPQERAIGASVDGLLAASMAQMLITCFCELVASESARFPMKRGNSADFTGMAARCMKFQVGRLGDSNVVASNREMRRPAGHGGPKHGVDQCRYLCLPVCHGYSQP